MALRKRPIAAGVAALLFSGWVSALGLGEIKLNSALNEPLDAEIPLINLGELEEGEILAGLAPPPQFEKAGVERQLLLTSLVFRLDLDAPGGPVLRVNSRKPIREPYLDFLVEVEWPSGRLLREYTLLLDLPVYARSDAARERARPGAEPSSQARSPRQRDSTPRRAQPAPRPDPVEGVVASGETYEVRDGNTLWSIASDLPSDASVHQKMAAIHQLNPDAFIDGDINLLKRGAVLRLPDTSQIREADGSALAGGGAEQRRADSAPQLSGSSRSQASARQESADTSGRLKLSTTDSDAGETGSPGSGAGDNGGAALRTELDTIEEELDRSRRENQELKQRLSSLEEQITTMQRLIELGDGELRAAQLAAMTEDMSDEEMEQAAEVLAEADLIEEDEFEASPSMALFPSADRGSSRRKPATPAGDEQPEGENGETGGAGNGESAGTPQASAQQGTADATPAEQTPPEASQSGAEDGDDVAQAERETGTADPDAANGGSRDSDSGSMSLQTEEKGWFDTVSSYLAYVIGALVIVGAAVYYFLRRRRDESEYREMPAEPEAPAAPRPTPRQPAPTPAPPEPESRVRSVDDIDLREEDDLFEQPGESEPTTFDETAYARPRQEDQAPEEPGEPAPETGAGADAESPEDIELDLSEFELDDPGTAAPETSRADPAEQAPGELNLDEEFDLLGDVDEGDTQLELAQAYMEMGDQAGAREILQEVAENGSSAQKDRARELLGQLS